MIRQVLQGFADRRLMRRTDRLLGHVIPKSPHQRHRSSGHKTSDRNHAPPAHRGTARTPHSGHTRRRASAPPPPDRRPRPRAHRRSNRPCWRPRPHPRRTSTPGSASRVRSSTPPTHHRRLERPSSGLPRGAGGVVVVVHRPPRQLRHRQHATPPNYLGSGPPAGRRVEGISLGVTEAYDQRTAPPASHKNCANVPMVDQE